MPFHQRSVEPRRVSRLSARDGWRPAEEKGRRRLRRAVLFSALDDVACHTLTGLIYQLSDLSRHACDIFLGIEREAGEVFRRSYRVQGRLRSLQSEIHTLDPKKVQILFPSKSLLLPMGLGRPLGPGQTGMDPVGTDQYNHPLNVGE